MRAKKVLSLIFLLMSISLLWPFDVYFEDKEVVVGKESTLIINASNFSGKVRGVINFGNFIIKWDCVYLDNQIIKYKIIPSKTEGTVFFEFENGEIFSKTFKIKENKNYTPTTTYIYYVEEKNCFFESFKKEQRNKITKENINRNNNYLLKTEKKKKEEKNNYLFIFVILLLVLLVFVSYYFYRLGKEESKIEERLQNTFIPKIKKEIMEIENEGDYKKKAFLLYKLISNDNYLKNKIGENKLQSLYYLSFKKEVNEEDKKFIEELIKKLKGG